MLELDIFGLIRCAQKVKTSPIMCGLLSWVILVVTCPMICGLPIERKADYTGHRVIRVHPKTPEQLRILQDIASDHKYNVDLWSEVIMHFSVDLQVPPEAFENVALILTDIGLHPEIRIHDLQRLIDKENEELRSSGHFRSKRSTTLNMTSQFYQQNLVGTYSYHTEINDWLEAAARERPEMVSTYDIGVSYEGRILKVIKIGSNRSRNKPGIWIDGGIHAREWISPATANYIIFSLIDAYGRDPNITQLVDMYDWYILPVANPDGYHYSMTWDRLYRKTRSRTRMSRWCLGVDANRNFDYMWRGHCETNSPERCRSADPCDNTFAGAQPFSEPETIAMANFLLRMRGRIHLYLSLHSYSQMWLTPWGFTKHKPLDFERLINVALTGATSLKARYGTEYYVGSPAEILYAAGGGSYDWAKGVAGIPFSFTLELRDKGQWGFLLPRSQIIPTGEETLDAVLATVRSVAAHMRVNSRSEVNRRRSWRRGVHPLNSFSNARYRNTRS